MVGWCRGELEKGQVPRIISYKGQRVVRNKARKLKCTSPGTVKNKIKTGTELILEGTACAVLLAINGEQNRYYKGGDMGQDSSA